MAFAGATVDDALYEELVAKGWLSYPSKVESAAHGGLPPGLKHRCGAAPRNSQLTRSLNNADAVLANFIAYQLCSIAAQ